MTQELTARQIEAVHAVLRCATLSGAARATGLKEATLRMWIRQPAFARELDAQQRSAADIAFKRLSAAASVAVTTLTAVCNDHEVYAGNRVTAAAKILDLVWKLREREDFDQRLAELERRMSEDLH